MAETGFVKAQSDNLPKIDVFMMSTYFASNSDFTAAELRGVKAASSLFLIHDPSKNTDNMSFYGKKFKRSDMDSSVVEVFASLGLSEKTLSMLRTPNATTSFEKNSDGTIQYKAIGEDGSVLRNEKITPGKEFELTSPDGDKLPSLWTVSDSSINNWIKAPNGKVLHFDRTFDANGFKMLVYADGLDTKGYVYYTTA